MVNEIYYHILMSLLKVVIIKPKMYVKKLKSPQSKPKPVLVEGAFSRARSRLVSLWEWIYARVSEV